jgi:hypothetical protein
LGRALQSFAFPIALVFLSYKEIEFSEQALSYTLLSELLIVASRSVLA